MGQIEERRNIKDASTVGITYDAKSIRQAPETEQVSETEQVPELREKQKKELNARQEQHIKPRELGAKPKLQPCSKLSK
eukprot:3336636-Ditylum_brightwellii.AAC.1